MSTSIVAAGPRSHKLFAAMQIEKFQIQKIILSIKKPQIKTPEKDFQSAKIFSLDSSQKAGPIGL